MLSDRIIGAFTFRRGIYADVEKDPGFTQTAWLIVVVVSFLSQLGAHAGRGFTGWIVGALLGTVMAVIGFALAAFVISWVGATVFRADVNFEEMVRTLGLAYVWNILGFVGVISFFAPFLVCIASPLLFLGWIAALIAWFVAAKEALDLEWAQTIITVVIGWVIMFVLNLITGAILGFLGFGAAALGSVFQQ